MYVVFCEFVLYNSKSNDVRQVTCDTHNLPASESFPAFCQCDSLRSSVRAPFWKERHSLLHHLEYPCPHFPLNARTIALVHLLPGSVSALTVASRAVRQLWVQKGLSANTVRAKCLQVCVKSAEVWTTFISTISS